MIDFLGFLRSKLHRLFLRVVRPKFRPLSRNVLLESIGSPHGYKFIAESEELSASLLLSGGLGEDMSFEAEWASKSGGRVLLVDPTPRSKTHFDQVMDRCGLSKEEDYGSTGNLSPNQYDLVRVSREQFLLFEGALWSSTVSTLELFPPENPDHVSFSIHDLQATNLTGNSIFAPAITVAELLSRSGLESQTFILKLDIEGAALEVLESTFASGLKPRQILVEFDEMFFPSFRNYLRVRKTLSLLHRASYIMVSESTFDCVFIPKELLKKW